MPSVLDLIQKTPEGDYKPKIDKGFVGLLVGESGSGKDSAVASFPKPIYVFDVDHRIAGMLNSVEWLGLDEIRKIDYDQYSILTGLTAIDKKCEELLAKAKTRTLEYKTIYFASISSMGQMFALASRKLRGSKPGEPGDFLDAKFASQAIRNLMYSFVMPMQSLGFNIVFAAHVVPKWGKPKQTTEDKGLAQSEIIGEKLVGVSDQFSEEVPGYFDNVFRFSKEDLNRGVVYWCEFTGDLAKTSYPIKEKKIELTRKSFFVEFTKLTEKMRYTFDKSVEKK